MNAQSLEVPGPTMSTMTTVAHSRPRASMWVEVMKLLIPALITGVTTIWVASKQSASDLEKSASGITGLAQNYNGLVDQAKSDHDELTRLRGVVDLLASAVIKHQDGFAAVDKLQKRGDGDDTAVSARPRPARARPVRPAVPAEPARAGADNPAPPTTPVATTSTNAAGTKITGGAETLQRLRDDVRAAPGRTDSPRFEFKARKAPTTFDELLRSARQH